MAHLAKQPENKGLTDEMMETMECPVCYKLPRGEVHQCYRGHHMCSDCRAKLTDCPTCREPLGTSRNFPLEKLLAEMTHACKFTEKGCAFQGTIAKLEPHEQDCKYRLVNCCFLYCDKHVSMARLFTHIEKDHKGVFGGLQRLYTCQKFAETYIEKGPRWFEPYYLIKGNDHFFLETWQTAEGHWYTWLYKLGSREECKDSTYTIKILGEGKKELTFRSYCVPLDDTKEKVAEEGNCLHISNATARWLMSNDRIKFMISSIEESS